MTRLRDLPPAPGRLGPAPGRAEVDPAPLLGVWRNYDEHGTGIAGVELSIRAGALTLHATSVVDARRVAWGATAAAAFGGAVDDRTAVGFTAGYDFGYLRVLIAAYLNTRLLVVDAYSVFTADGRSPYFQRDHLYLPRPDAHPSNEVMQ